MPWSARDLKPNFKRQVVGFDVRETPSKNYPPRSQIQYLGTWYAERLPRLSIDEAVWPSLYLNKDDGSSNSYSLAESLSDLDHIGGGVIAAFDLPWSWIEVDRSRPEVFASPVDYEPNGVFCGFDVVDLFMFRDASGFYSFGWSLQEMKEILSSNDIRLNECGLAANEKSALAACEAFSNRFPGHSPFGPCGVWIVDWRGHRSIELSCGA